MSADKQIWILEDDPGARFVFDETLGHRYPSVFLTSLQEFYNRLNSDDPRPALLIADLKLGDGTFLGLLRDETVSIDFPFMVVSSMDDVDALRFCFKKGALDYIVKPFQKSELIAKTERALAGATLAAFSDSVADAFADLQLTATERNILNRLLDAGPAGIGRDFLIDEVWVGVNVNPKTVDVHISNTRKKLATRGFDIRSAGHGKWVLAPLVAGDSSDGMED